MRLLVTGAAGMCAREVLGVATARGHEVLAPDERDLDVCDRSVLARAFAELRPDAIVNCAAWTDVDGAESSEDAALAVNGVAPGLLAEAANDCGAHLVHISTDYVFDGSAKSPYVESDLPNPQTAYGRTKLSGERAVLGAGGGHAIVRTAWLFGVGGRNLVATMLKLASDGRDEVAELRLRGVMHVAGGGQCSWAELAAATFAACDIDCRVRPLTTKEYPLPAPRPAWSVLASERPDVPRLPPWQDGLATYLEQVRVEASR